MVPELSPKYMEHLSFESLTAQQFLVLIIEAAKKLNWNIGLISEDGFIAYRNQSNAFQTEELEVEINGKYANLESRYTGLQIPKEHQNKDNLQALLSIFIGLKNTLNPDEVAGKYEALRTNFVSKRISLLSQPPSTIKEDIRSFIGIFKTKADYYFTPILIDLNILIFLGMFISGVNITLPDQANLIKWGANFTPLILKGEWWRLITSCYLHIGILHLLMNMYALMYIGLLLEPHLGKTRFIIAYLLTGVGASLTSFWWHEQILSVGASGAIFGMYGVFLALLTTNIIEKSSRQALLTSIGVFVVYNLIGGMKYGIDNAAHIGGLISGIIIGYVYYPGLKKRISNF